MPFIDFFWLFTLLWLEIRLYNFDVLATTLVLVLFEPPVLWSWRAIVGSSHLSKKRRLGSTLTIAKPHMTLSFVDLVSKGMVYRELEACLRVDLVHFLDEVRTMPIPTDVPLFSCFGQPQPSMDQLVQ